jgi:uncharacterized protein YciI
LAFSIQLYNEDKAMQFLVIGWDAPGSKEKRPDARPAHLEHWADWNEAGRVMVAGPMTDFAGSLFIVEAETQAEVEVKAQADPYVAAGVFERTEVHPFKTVIGKLTEVL